MTEQQLLDTQGLQAIYASHLIELVVSLMGKPDRIVSFTRQTRADVGVQMCDNGLIVFEYPKTTATIRTSSLEVDSYQDVTFPQPPGRYDLQLIGPQH